MIEFTPKTKGSLGKNYLYRCTAFGLRRRASSPALRAGEGPLRALRARPFAYMYVCIEYAFYLSYTCNLSRMNLCTWTLNKNAERSEHWALSDCERSSQFEIWLVLRLNGAKLLQYYIYNKRRASRAARASREFSFKITLATAVLNWKRWKFQT